MLFYAAHFNAFRDVIHRYIDIASAISAAVENMSNEDF